MITQILKLTPSQKGDAKNSHPTDILIIDKNLTFLSRTEFP